MEAVTFGPSKTMVTTVTTHYSHQKAKKRLRQVEPTGIALKFFGLDSEMWR